MVTASKHIAAWRRWLISFWMVMGVGGSLRLVEKPVNTGVISQTCQAPNMPAGMKRYPASQGRAPQHRADPLTTELRADSRRRSGRTRSRLERIASSEKRQRGLGGSASVRRPRPGSGTGCRTASAARAEAACSTWLSLPQVGHSGQG
jgi:hypothetical protein